MNRRLVVVALGTVAALAVVSPAVGGPSLKQLVKDEVAKQIDTAEVAKKKKKKARRGPRGPRGRAGPQGPQGPAGSQANLTVEPMHVLGSPGEPALNTNWSNLGSGTSTAAFYKDPFGIVHLRGNITNAVGTPLGIFGLPNPSYWPAQTQIFAVKSDFMTSPGISHVQVGSDGVVILQSGSTENIALDGITWRAGN